MSYQQSKNTLTGVVPARATQRGWCCGTGARGLNPLLRFGTAQGSEF